MAALNVDFTGDCTGLINAANRSKAEVRSFDGMRATAAVSLTGAGSVASDLGKVQSAVGSAGGTVTVGMDTSGISAGRAEIAGARADVRAFGREADALGGARAFSLTDGGSIQQANRELSGMRQNLKGASEDFQATSRAGTESGSALESSYGRVGTAAAGMGGQIEASTAQVRQHAMAMAGGSDSVVSANASAAASFGDVERGMAGVSSQAALTRGQMQSVTSALDSGSLGNAYAAFDAAHNDAARVAGGGGPPPPVDNGDDGGRGGNKPPRPPKPPPPGANGGSMFDEGGLFNNGITKAGGALDSGIGKLGMPALVGAAIGVVEAVAPAAVGMLAMNAVVGATPALAYASGKAMHQMAAGIREGSQGATAAGVPAFQALGQALKPLGQEIGQIGAANIGKILGAETSLAGGATSALKALAPTIAPSIAAVENLGNAFLKGISNPAVAAGITATANALSTPAAAQAVSDITSAVLTGSSYLAQGATQAVTDLTGQGQGATNVGSGWKTQPAGETVAEHSGGMFSYHPNDDTGQAAAAPIPGGGSGVGWNQNTMLGTGMTALGSVLHAGGVGIRDFANGSMFRRDSKGTDARAEMRAASDDANQRMGRALTPGGADLPDPGGPGTSAGGSSSPSALAAAQETAPHGYDKAQDGSLTPSAGPRGGGGWYPGGPGTGGSGVQSVQPPGLGAPPPKPPTTAPMGGGAGGGSSFGSLTPAQVQGLSSSLPGLSANLAKVAPSAQQMSSGLQQATPGAAQLSHGLQQVGQSAAQMSPPMAAVSQHTAAATAAVQNLSQQAPAAVSAVQAVAPAAHAALAAAAPTMQTGGAALGATASTAVASGITGNQQAACDASQKMMNSAANCAKAAAGISSPSKIFQGFGMNLPEGLAIGVQNATPLALAAVQSSMQQVVAAGQAGLQTASPSKTFQQMGAQHAADAAKAYAAGSNARYPQADNAQNDMAKQAQVDAEKNSPQAKSDAAFAAHLQKMGYDSATKARLTADHQKEQDKTQADLAKKAHPERDAALNARKDDAQRRAMEAAGVRGLKPTDPNANPNDPNSSSSVLSPHNQRAKDLFEGRKVLEANAKDLVTSGLTSKDPAAVARRLTGKPGAAGDAAQQRSLNEQGRGMGDSFSKGMKGGIDKGAGGAGESAGNMSANAVVAAKKKTKSHSPSQEFHDIGLGLDQGLANGVNAGAAGVASSIGDVMSGAMGSGVAAASNGVMGIASNSGLAVGYQWARGVSSGADSVLKTSDFGQVSLPQIGSALAKVALGAGGMLGPAGSGASIPNHLTITMGAGAPAVPNVTATVIAQFGDQTIQAIAQQVVNVALGQLADSIPQQVG